MADQMNDEEFNNFMNNLNNIFEVVDQSSTSKDFEISENVKNFMKHLEKDDDVSVRAVPIITNDEELMKSMEILSMLQGLQGLLPEDDSEVMMIKPVDLPKEISILMDDIIQRKEAGQSVSNEESEKAMKTMVTETVEWMLKKEGNSKLKQLMSLMLHRMRTGKTSPVTDQAILSLLSQLEEEKNSSKKIDNHLASIGVACDHMKTHHLDSAGIIDTEVGNTAVFQYLNGLLNSKFSTLHKLSHIVIESSGKELHDNVNTLLISMFLEGLMTGWYAANGAQDCLGAEMHSK